MGILSLQQDLLMSTPHIKSVTGNPVTFDADMIAPINKAEVSFEPSQDTHGLDPYPPGASKNLIPDGKNTSNGYISGTRLNSDGTTEAVSTLYVSEYFQVTAGETYTWSCLDTSVNLSGICFYDVDKTYISGVQASKALPKTFTAPQDAVYCRSTQQNALDEIFQLEVGSSATTIKPYSNVCPIQEYYNLCNINRTDGNFWDDKNWWMCGWSLVTSGTYEGYYNGKIVDIRNCFNQLSGGMLLTRTNLGRITVTYTRAGSTTTVRPTFHYDDGTSNYGSNQDSIGDITRTSTAGKNCVKFVLNTNAGNKAGGIYIKNLQIRQYKEGSTFPLPEQNFKSVYANIPTNGKNLYDSSLIITGFYIPATGIAARSTGLCYSGLIPVTEGSTYTYSATNGASSNVKRIHAYADGVWQEQIVASSSIAANTSYSITFTVPSGANGVRISTRADETNGQLELGSTATSYEPYRSAQYGTYNFSNGSLKNDWSVIEFDGSSDENWKSSSIQRFYISVTPQPYYIRSSNAYILCNKLKPVSASSLGSNSNYCCYVDSANALGVRINSSVSTLDGFRAWLSQNPIKVVYKRGVSGSSQLQGEKILTLLKKNNVWTNLNNISLEYWNHND